MFSNLQAPRQKSSTNEKLLPKDDSKIQTPVKKGIVSAAAEDSDKTVKHRPPVLRKSSETTNGLNLVNLVKVVPSNRKWTDGSVSWQTLPSSLAKLGKVCFVLILFDMTNLVASIITRSDKIRFLILVVVTCSQICMSSLKALFCLY